MMIKNKKVDVITDDILRKLMREMNINNIDMQGMHGKFDSIECGVGIFNINKDFYINDANKALVENDYLVWLSREYLRSIIQ